MATSVNYDTQQYFGFDPRTIPGCQLWLDAADTRTFTFSSSTNISTWTDKSQNALVGTAINSPTQTANSINGLPAVVFSTGTQYIDYGNNLNLGTNSVYIFTVVKFDSTADGAIVGKSRNAALAGRWSMIRQAAGGGMIMLADVGGGGFLATYSDTSTNPQLVTGYWDRSNVIIGQNGTQRNSIALANTSSFSTTDLLWVGAYQSSTGGSPPTASLFLNGRIGEIIVYQPSSPLTAIQRQQVEGYLAWKWGLQTNLPTSHPFRPNPTTMRIFQPNDISNLALWLDAADSSTFTYGISAPFLTVWRDKSGNGYNLSNTTGSTARQPQTTSAYNNRQMVRWLGTPSGSSNLISNSSFSLVLSNCHVIFVGQGLLNTNGFYPGVVAIGTGGAGNESLSIDGGNPSGGTTYRMGFYGSFGGNNIPGSAPFPYGIYGMNVSNNAGLLFQNGTQTTSVTYTFPATNQTLIGLGMRYLNGAFQNLGNGNSFDGLIGEMLIYSRPLLEGERQRIEGYLASKWGISGSLPTTQPYYLLRALPSTPLFVPSSLSNLVVWLDAADMSTMFQNTAGTTPVTSFGQTVNNWRDKSGSGLNAVATGTGATYQLNAGYPSLTFNGNRMNTSTIPSTFLDSTGVTFFAVSTRTGTNITQGVLGTLVPEKVIRYDPANCIYTINNGTLRGGNNNTNGIRCFIDTASSFNGFVNGTNVLTSSTAVTYQAQTTSTFYQLGNLGSGANLFQGYINEIIVFNTAITAIQRQQVEGYLAWKWGIQNSLPITHPYYRFRP